MLEAELARLLGDNWKVSEALPATHYPFLHSLFSGQTRLPQLSLRCWTQCVSKLHQRPTDSALVQPYPGQTRSIVQRRSTQHTEPSRANSTAHPRHGSSHGQPGGHVEQGCREGRGRRQEVGGLGRMSMYHFSLSSHDRQPRPLLVFVSCYVVCLRACISGTFGSAACFVSLTVFACASLVLYT